MLSTRNSFQLQGHTHRLKVKRWKNIFYTNGNQKKAGVVLSDKIDSKVKTVLRDKKKKKNYIIIKESIQQEDITFVNIYSPASEHLNI